MVNHFVRAAMLLAVLAGPVWAGVVDPMPVSDRSAAHTNHAERLSAELGAKGFLFGAPIYIRIFKASRELELWVEGTDGYRLFRTYPICAMSGTLGPKLKRGDWQAPEGFYSVDADWMHPHSRFHLAFNIGYPNDFDRARGRTGSAIMVHGGCDSRGCFAMTDEIMEEIYVLAEAALRHSQQNFPVHVFPFRMTDENLRAHRDSEWHEFWLMLRAGYDSFLETGVPPASSTERLALEALTGFEAPAISESRQGR
ncbi:MAG: L,D-transpeptidase family protein [Wenzhouxiangella sp.]